MHYFIDGYNLLFRLSDDPNHLQKRRTQLIDHLLKQAELLELSVTVVFDSVYQAGDVSRGHKGNLEIIYTAHGETADDYILEALQHTVPAQETVVTSDKKLAWKARALQAHTESINDFLSWLSRRVQNKKRPVPKKLLRLNPPVVKPATPKSTEPSASAKAEDCVSYYEKHFEEKFHQLMAEAEKEQEAKREARRPPGKKKAKKSVEKKVKTPLSPLSELQRWLELFDK